MANPSTRRVATRLRQAGFSISHMRVARWRNQGWRRATREDHPLEAARASLDDAVPLLTGDPTTIAEALVERDRAARAKLEQLTDKELLTAAARELAITQILVSRALQEQAGILVVTKPKEIGVLVLALANCLKAIAAGFGQALSMQPSTPAAGGGSECDGTENDPLEAAFRAWEDSRR